MSKLTNSKLHSTLDEVRRCTLCKPMIPEPRPVVRANSTARILIIGQAPGTKVHASGVPWDDASGKRLRTWLGVNEDVFYDESVFAIVPMGFCYPGKGKSGDLPPRPECAPTWHEKILQQMPDIQCTLLIGMYAQNYYLTSRSSTLTERVKNWRDYAPTKFVLPHPSPRNQLWLRKNPWFENEIVPALQNAIKNIL